MSQLFLEAAKLKLPDISNEVFTIIEEETDKTLVEIFYADDGYFSQAVQIYKTYYSEDDIEELLVFYKSDLGQKIINNNPKITQDMMAASEKISKSTSAVIWDRIKTRLTSEGYNIEE